MTMYKGSVEFIATIDGSGATFRQFDFNPSEKGVEKVEIEGLNGDEIHSTVYFSVAQSPEAGIQLATKVITVGLNRLAFSEDIAIVNCRVGNERFSSLDDEPGTYVLVAGTGRYSLTGADAKLIVGRSPERLKGILEQQSAPGERYYGLYRSARQSIGPTEEFMHLYHILLMLYKDKQADVDSFILTEDASVPQTQHPLKAHGVKETVYTRLRNEFAHARSGVDLEQTKAEIAQRLVDLRALTKRAIELCA